MSEKKFAQPPNDQSHFSAVPAAEVQRSKFNRSHSYKTTFDAGPLIPVFVDEVLPGDTFSLSATTFARLATPLKPIMDNLYLDIHYFFVPNRLVWDNWQFFMGERKKTSDDPSTKTVPWTEVLLNRPVGDVADYFGIPRNEAASATAKIWVNALPFRGYQLIYNEWYRDQNLMDSLEIATGDNAALQGAITPYYRCKNRDYFTSCLPWPQKGDAVSIPIANTAPVVSNSNPVQFQGVNDATNRTLFLGDIAGAPGVGYGGTMVTTQNARFGIETGLIADLSAAADVSINDLRTSFQIQRLLERDARGGTRYIEIILSHFGVHSDDARLQRPEFLGGQTKMISINPVAMTASTDSSTSITGELAAYGTVVNKSGFTKSFTEHGFVFGIASVRADLTYSAGIERMWKRSTRYDYYWPALAHLGEQAVHNREIYVQGANTFPGDSDNDKAVFGYQERYAEYRYKPGRLTGLMQPHDSTSLDVWHLGEDFAGPPTLSSFFIINIPPIDRIIAVPGEPHFICDIWFNLICERPMPVYSVPGMIDHF